MEKRFVRVRSIKDVVIFLSLIIIGVFLVLFPDVEAAYLGGWTLILIGVVTGLMMKSAYKDVETGEVFLKRELLYSADMKQKILSAMSHAPQIIEITKSGNGQNLMLRIYYSKKSQKCYLQLFEYVPHQWESCSDVCSCELCSVERLIRA